MTAIGLLIVMLSFPAGAIADRINDRAESRKVREAAFWTTVLCALLLIGGVITVIAGVLIKIYQVMP
jgi:membrane protein YqaA with SNARE-associated domain